MSQAMKDSGVEWIGEIPADWEVRKFKYIFRIVSGAGFKDKYQGNSVGKYPFCKASDINGSDKYVSIAKNYVNDDVVKIENYTVIPMYSILIAKIGEALKKNHRKINLMPCIVDNNCEAFVLRPDENVLFWFYVLNTIDMCWFDNGGTIPSVNNGKLNSFELPYIRMKEQRRIASYLDTKCGKIDAVIAREQAVIAKLKEYKQSLITEVVTKGLDPEVPMKDSGVDWIGQIPATWEVTQISHLFNLKAGGDVKKEFFSYDYDVRHPYPVYTNTTQKNQVYGYTEKPFFEKNTITVTGRGFIGYAVYRENSYDAIIRLLVLSPKNKKNCKYYMYCINSIPSFTVESSAIGQLSTQQMAPFMVCVPSLSEQQQIVAYLDTKCAKIDATIARKQALIEKLGEYKKSLIYEVVTGKKEVG